MDIAQESIIWTLSHNPQSHEAIGGNVTVGDYCWIECRVIIMPGVCIGEDSICAACAVITKKYRKEFNIRGYTSKEIIYPE